MVSYTTVRYATLIRGRAGLRRVLGVGVGIHDLLGHRVARGLRRCPAAVLLHVVVDRRADPRVAEGPAHVVRILDQLRLVAVSLRAEEPALFSLRCEARGRLRGQALRRPALPRLRDARHADVAPLHELQRVHRLRRVAQLIRAHTSRTLRP